MSLFLKSYQAAYSIDLSKLSKNINKITTTILEKGKSTFTLIEVLSQFHKAIKNITNFKKEAELINFYKKSEILEHKMTKSFTVIYLWYRAVYTILLSEDGKTNPFSGEPIEAQEKVSNVAT